MNRLNVYNFATFIASRAQHLPSIIAGIPHGRRAAIWALAKFGPDDRGIFHFAQVNEGFSSDQVWLNVAGHNVRKGVQSHTVTEPHSYNSVGVSYLNLGYHRSPFLSSALAPIR